jgi:aminopeptidase N
MSAPRWILPVAVTALALLVGGCSEDAAGPTSTGPDPGDADYFPGTGSDAIDVVAYDVDAEVAIDGVDRLDAVATLDLVALEPLDSFELDLTGLDVGEVTVDGEAATTTATSTRLTVTPPSTIEEGARVEVRIPYGGEPAGESDPFTTLEEGGGGWLDLGAYSAVVSEPIGASTWLPSNDLPSDKATFALDVTVPMPLTAVSNGLLDGTTVDTQRATTTFHWSATEPMAPYLMTLAIGAFELVDSTVPGGAVRIDAVPPDTDPEVRAELARFPDMVSFLERRLGAYPFDAAGNVVVPGMPPTALETQTRSVLSLAALQEPGADQLVLHELAHQWFGDSVTPETWADVWLNEGPAVYLQWMWAAANGGPTVEDAALASYDPDDPELAVPPADPGPDQLFGVSVYERSAIFLFELERHMGTESFDELLRTWLQRHADANATTDDFVELAGEVHGESIRPLSDPWLYGDELPDLSS